MLLLLLPFPECPVPAGLSVLGLQGHSWVSDSLVGMSSAVSAKSQTHRIIYIRKNLQDHRGFAPAGREEGNSGCVGAEGESWAAGEAGQAQSSPKNVPAALPIQSQQSPNSHPRSITLFCLLATAEGEA